MVVGVNHRRDQAAFDTFLDLLVERRCERHRVQQVELEGANHLTFHAIAAHEHRDLAGEGRLRRLLAATTTQ